MTKEEILLRIQRDALLNQSDWTQGSDSPLSNSKKDEWKTYRQSLRDLHKTANPKLDDTKLLLDMSSVTFPTKPS